MFKISDHPLLPILSGVFVGCIGLLQELGNPLLHKVSPWSQNSVYLVAALLSSLSLLLLQRLIDQHIANYGDVAQRRYHRFFSIPYALLIGIAAAGLMLNLAPAAGVWLTASGAWLLGHGVLFCYSIGQNHRRSLVLRGPYIVLLFFVSGFAALIYQVVWQRVLFTTFGVNNESVTVIVSVFMLGLGLGSLFAGLMRRRLDRYLLPAFMVLEAVIALYGLASLSLIEQISTVATTTALWSLTLWVYLILAVPTLCMGATLPLLVAYLHKSYHNTGRSVGFLYAANTLGSAVASFATVYLLFVYLGQQATVWVAVGCNLSTIALLYYRHRIAGGTSMDVPLDMAAAEAPVTQTLSRGATYIGLAAIGYLSLSQEILWYRLLGYMTANKPQVFGAMLAAFLTGIAFSALYAARLCRDGRHLYRYVLLTCLALTATFYFAIPVIAALSVALGKMNALSVTYAFVLLTAALSGGLLPVLIHMSNHSGRGDTADISGFYFANIIGATAGPLVTGFVLLDHFTLSQNVLLITGLALLFLVFLCQQLPLARQTRQYCLLSAILGIGGLTLLHPLVFDQYLEKLYYGKPGFKPFVHVVENRAGILTVEHAAQDIMYGNGIYDGRFNTDPVINSNHVTRAYMVAALHPEPKHVLEIGMSTNSWSSVLTSHATVETLDIIEINKGYADLFRYYPESAAVMTNPKVTVHYDDGRRWLRRHPEKRYDVIVMNTTFHWRNNATNLLSKEFLLLCKNHLNAGGVIYYNTTQSPHVYRTAAAVFQHVTTVANFVAASDRPFTQTVDQKRASLLRFLNRNGLPLFEQTSALQETLATLSTMPLPELRPSLLENKNAVVVTDDNMAVEYKTWRKP